MPEAVLVNNRLYTLLWETRAAQDASSGCGTDPGWSLAQLSRGLEEKGFSSGLPPPPLSCLEMSASLIATDTRTAFLT